MGVSFLDFVDWARVKVRTIWGEVMDGNGL